jgi:hypothetical protein
VILLGFASLVFSLFLSSYTPEITVLEQNIWFGSATSRVLDNIDPNARLLQRAHLHPLFSILLLPLAKLISLSGCGALLIGRIIISLSGAFITTTLFATLRFNKLSPLSSLLACCMFLCSGAYVFWWSVVETFPIGGAAISLVFLLISANINSIAAWALTTPLTLGITLTNWFVCIVGVFHIFEKKKALRLLFSGLLISATLLVVQGHYYENYQSIKNTSLIEKKEVEPASQTKQSNLLLQKIQKFQHLFMKESNYVVYPQDMKEASLFFKKYLERGLLFVSSPAVAADVEIEGNDVNQHLGLVYGFFGYSAFGWVAIVSWFLLLFQGAFCLFKTRNATKLSKTLLYFLLFQFLLHLFYGDNPFLYCAHFMFALIVVASYSFQGQRTRIFQGIALLYCASALISNLQAYFDAIALIHTLHG